MAGKESKRTKPSAPAQVDAYLRSLEHPLINVVVALGKTILEADSEIGEEIKWNAPAFFFAGEMTAFNPKEYRRHLVVFNFFRKDVLRLVFWGGARADDESGFHEGDYPDGRRLALFRSLAEVKARKKQLQAVLRRQLATMEK
jgi:hypothetical protein